MAISREASASPAPPRQADLPARGRRGQRLGKGFGLLIDRAKPVGFSFEGRAYSGLQGDVIASALASAGQWVLSRSFKYHRPRGVLTMAGQDANTLVQLPDEPNALADRHPISAGLEVLGQNYRGSLEKDDYAWLDHFGRFMPVGFYYRTFFKPKGAWKHWEPRIRAMAGLGVINKEAVHGYYDKAYGFHDVVVVGGGPAGMSAAIEAGKAGLDVLLLDEWPVLGGSLAYARFGVKAGKAERLRKELIAEIEATPSIEVMTSAVCTGAFADNWLPVIKGNRLYKVRAGHVILATGSFEQPMVFRNNDLPGVMLSSAAQRLMRLYAVAPGRRGVIATANDHGYELALDLLEAGIEIAALVDSEKRCAAERADRRDDRTRSSGRTGKRPFTRRSASIMSRRCVWRGSTVGSGPASLVLRSPAISSARQPATALKAILSGTLVAPSNMTTIRRCIGSRCCPRG